MRSGQLLLFCYLRTKNKSAFMHSSSPIFPLLHLYRMLLSKHGHFHLAFKSINSWLNQMNCPSGACIGFWWSEFAKFCIISTDGYSPCFKVYIFPCQRYQLPVTNTRVYSENPQVFCLLMTASLNKTNKFVTGERIWFYLGLFKGARPLNGFPEV